MPNAGLRVVFLSRARVWNLLILIVSVLLFLLFLHRTVYMGPGDFSAYQNAAIRFWRGQPLYIQEETPFKYLPGALTFFLPFAFLPQSTAKLVFYLLSFTSAAAFYSWTTKVGGRAVALVTLLTLLRFHNADFNSAQVNALLLGLWALLQRSLSRKKLSHAASLLGLISSFKVLPLAGFAAFAFKGKWKSLGFGASTFFLINAAILFASQPSALMDWYFLLKSTTPSPAPDAEIIQSVQGAVWFWSKTLRMQHFFPLFLLLGSAAFLAGLFFRLYKDKKGRAPLQLWLEVLLGVTVVFSPLAWKHGYVLLAPLFVWVARSRGWRIALAHSMGLVVVPTLLAILLSQELADRTYSTLLGGLYLIWHAAGLRVAVGIANQGDALHNSPNSTRTRRHG